MGNIESSVHNFMSGAKEQNSANSATDDIIVTGANVQDSADLDDDDDYAADNDDNVDDDDDGDDGDDDDGNADDDEADDGADDDDETPPTDKKQGKNSAYAEIRRKAEAAAAAKAANDARRIADTEINKTIADLGFVDPYTKKPITTKAEYDAYKAKHNSELITKQLEKAGISKEALDAAIESHPAVQQAKAAAAAHEEAQRQAQMQSAKVRLDSQLSEISKLDPKVKTVDDLIALPNYAQIKAYVDKGLTIVESFKLANMDKLSSKKASAAAQSVYNKTQSKEHLTSTTSHGQGDTPISSKQMQQYRQLMPDMTDKQIRAYHAKFLKKYS